MPSEDSGPDRPPYPGARRRYRRLGILHALLFGGVPAARLWVEGRHLLGILALLVFGGAFLGVDWWLADEHYRGDVPGKPGAYTSRRGNDGE